MTARRKRGGTSATAALIWLAAAGLCAADTGPEGAPWRVAMNEFAPFTTMTDAGASGLVTEILRIIAAAEGATLDVTLVQNPGEAIDAVRRGEADIVPALAPSDARRQVLSFSSPVAWIEIGLYMPAETASTIGEVWGPNFRIGYVSGAYTQNTIGDMPDIQPVAYPTPSDLLLALAQREIDGALYAETAFAAIAAALEIEASYTRVGPALDRIPLTIAVDANNPALLQTIEARLGQLADTPALDQLRAVWSGAEAPAPAIDTRLVIAAILTIAALAGTSMLVTWVRMRNRLLAAALRRAEEKEAFASTLAKLNRDLKNNNEEMETLLYVATHDLKSPLVSIAGFTKRAGRAIDDGDGPGAQTALDKVARNVKQMGTLIEGILELGKIGRRAPTLEAVSVGELLADVRVALHAMFEARDAKLSHGPLPVVRTDADLLRRALQNLIENALTHGCPQPGMTIQVLAETEGDAVWIGVRDQGPGIPEDQQDHVFSLYRQLPGSKGGSGLGLSIVKKIADTLGGRTWVAAGAEGGATFWIAIPDGALALPPLEQVA